MKALIWDFDGTLGYRRCGAWTAALLEVLHGEEAGLAVDAARIGPYLQAGFPWHEPQQPHPEIRSAGQWWQALEPLFARAFRGAGLDPARAGELAGRVRAVYADPARWRLFDDALPALEALSAVGWRHLLLTNHVPELPAILDHLGLSPHLAAVLNSAWTGYEKPHPRAFHLAIEAAAGAQPVWMVGDSYLADVAGAGAAGIPAILVRRPHPQARYFCPGLDGLPAILDAPRPPAGAGSSEEGQMSF